MEVYIIIKNLSLLLNLKFLIIYKQEHYMLDKFDRKIIRSTPSNSFYISGLMLHALKLDYLLIWR